MAERPWRTVTVVLFVFLLAAQGVYSFAVKPEPYPSIRMPDFGPAAAPDKTFKLPIARAEVVNRDGSSRAVSPYELMADFHFDMARPSYDYLFKSSDPSMITPSVKIWLRNRLGEIEPGAEPTELRMCWQPTTISLTDASVVGQEPCAWRVVKF